jgi:MFS family permease
MEEAGSPAAKSSALHRIAVSTWPMWVLGLVIGIDTLDQSIVRGMVPQLKHAFHVGDFDIGVLLSAFVVVNGVVTLPAGYLADRWRRARTIGVTVVGWSAISALGAAAINFPVLAAIRGLLGFGEGITEPSANSLLADYYQLEERGRAFSVQQCLFFLGYGLGVAVGGALARQWGWRIAFLVSAIPGFLIALAAFSLKEPARGHADRVHAGIVSDDTSTERRRLFEEGFLRFLADMVSGLRADLATILEIKTMRYALVGVSALLFTVTAVGSWLPEFYERQMHIPQNSANLYFALLVAGTGIPGVIVGGRVADAWAHRIRGARMAIPAWCLFVAVTLFLVSYLDVPFWPAYILEAVGFFTATMSIPALRAGLSDAVPANLRGAGFGAFNLVSVVFGGAVAPIAVSFFSQAFGNDIRTAFLITTPPVYLGALLLLAARKHIDADAAKLFAKIVEAVQTGQGHGTDPLSRPLAKSQDVRRGAG